MEHIDKKLNALSFHIRLYYWIDFERLNTIYRFKTEEYWKAASNKFNIIPYSLPHRIFKFMPPKGGYFIGNISPGKIDVKWFCLGNCIAILSSLANPEQCAAIVDIIECRWTDLITKMPLKICYSAIEGLD